MAEGADRKQSRLRQFFKTVEVEDGLLQLQLLRMPKQVCENGCIALCRLYRVFIRYTTCDTAGFCLDWVRGR